MRILEILLPKSINNRDLSPKTSKHIDMLQGRMNSYVDKICDPKSSPKAKDFFKAKLKDDYDELKQCIEEIQESEVPTQQVQYEIIDTKTGLKGAKRGPYNSRIQASRAVDKLDNAYGGYRYKYREVKQINEATFVLPLVTKDFDALKVIMENPIPAIVASIYLADVIVDDELNDQFKFLEDTEPNRDVRPLVADWITRVMPDQLYRFDSQEKEDSFQRGILSPIHGYDPREFSGVNEIQTGDAFGRL
jgi:hypothetical protein